MLVLVACEESQAVCTAFRKLGHKAFSCDILECSGGHPEWHIQQDVLPLINGYCTFKVMTGTRHTILGEWHLIIAHPPCTYLSNAGARHLYPKGTLNTERFKLGVKAAQFFMKLYNAKCNHVCVENPVPSIIYGLPKYTQIIQPYEFGHPFSKKTCLWLRGLPLLHPTNIIPKDQVTSTRIAGNWFNKGNGESRKKNRSKTFPGIAEAMAEQWGHMRLL